MAKTNKQAFYIAEEIVSKEFVKTLPDELVKVPRSEWGFNAPPILLEVWRSKKYLVQIYATSTNVKRLSINKTSRHKGQWADKLTWDELQDIKDKVGYGDSLAIEIYPKNKDVVNVANMRHLWVLPFSLPFGWVNDGADLETDE